MSQEKQAMEHKPSAKDDMNYYHTLTTNPPEHADDGGPPPSSSHPAPNRAGPGYRLAALVVSLGALALLIVAACLDPDPSGMGTHKQLGQPECGFYQRTGYPCITCGMTTSFAHMVRGHVFRSFLVQPAGALAALLCLIVCLFAGYITLTGHRPDKLFFWLNQYAIYLLFLAGALVLLAWGWLCMLTWFREAQGT